MLGRLSNHLAIWVSAMGTFIAGYFALTTYMDSVAKQVDERKVQVMQLHQRFNSEPMFSIRKRVYAEISRAAGCNTNDVVAGPSDANDRFAFVEFFDVVEACTASKLCDEELTARLFAPYANGHWTYLKGYVEAVRTGEKDMMLSAPFGLGLERLAKRPIKLSC